MAAKISTTVRYLFASTMVTALVVAGLESASASQDEKLGVNSCGWEGNPCELAPIVVKAQRAGKTTAGETLIARR